MKKKLQLTDIENWINMKHLHYKDEMEYIQNQLPQMSSFEEDFSDLRSLGANESGSISSKSTIPRFERRKSSCIAPNQISKKIMKER